MVLVTISLIISLLSLCSFIAMIYAKSTKNPEYLKIEKDDRETLAKGVLVFAIPFINIALLVMLLIIIIGYVLPEWLGSD